jgi:hypothetical protein
MHPLRHLTTWKALFQVASPLAASLFTSLIAVYASSMMGARLVSWNNWFWPATIVFGWLGFALMANLFFHKRDGRGPSREEQLSFALLSAGASSALCAICTIALCLSMFIVAHLASTELSWTPSSTLLLFGEGLGSAVIAVPVFGMASWLAVCPWVQELITRGQE